MNLPQSASRARQAEAYNFLNPPFAKGYKSALALKFSVINLSQPLEKRRREPAAASQAQGVSTIEPLV